MYRNPIVIDQPPSPWHFLLSGLSQGVMTGMEDRRRSKEEKKNTMLQLLQGVMTGQIDPRMLATDVGREFLSSQGLTEEAPISKLIEEGRKSAGLLGPGNMGPPKPYSTSDYQTQLAGEEAARKEAEKQQELQKIRRKLNIEERVKQKYKPPEKSEETPEEIIQKIYRANEEAKRLELPVEDINMKGINLLTKSEADKEALARFEKKQAEAKGYEATYEANRSDVLKYKTDAVKTLAGYLSAKTLDDMRDINLDVWDRLGKGGVSILENEKFTPEQRSKLLAAEMNKEIKNYNRQLMSDGIRAGKGRDEIYQEELIDVDELLGKSKKGKSLWEGGLKVVGNILKKAVSGPEGQPNNPVNQPKIPVANAKDGKESNKRISKAQHEITNIYNEFKETDKDLSPEDMKTILMENKEEFKKEYGLNEVEFQTLLNGIRKD